MSIAWFTSVNIKYLDRAAILVETMKEAHPDWVAYLLLVDHEIEAETISLVSLFDEVIYPDEVVFEDPSMWLKVRQRDFEATTVEGWLGQHSVTEACTAIKPFGLIYLMGKHNFVFYLDPDIAVFNTLETVLQPLVDGKSVILTPHQLRPEIEWQAIIDNEIGTLRTGVYNLGFLGVNSKHPEAIKFSEFWKERLKYFCLEDSKIGLHTDQKWINLAPIYFKDIHVTSNPGLNVASWNLTSRHMSVQHDGTYLVEGVPLIFYHFSQAKDIGQVMADRYSKGNAAVADVWRWYLEKLEQNECFVPRVNWKYDSQA
jgi:hypothetical protein